MPELAYQLDSCRNFGPIPQTFATLAEAGIRNVEGCGGLIQALTQVAALAGDLVNAGLRILNAHIGLVRLRDAEGWRTLRHEIHQIAKRYSSTGPVAGGHNHDVESTDQGAAHRRLGLILGAHRPLAVQLKDVAPTGEIAGEDGWATLGHGALDWPRATAAPARTPARYLVPEHDNPSDDRRFIESPALTLGNTKEAFDG